MFFRNGLDRVALEPSVKSFLVDYIPDIALLRKSTASLRLFYNAHALHDPEQYREISPTLVTRGRDRKANHIKGHQRRLRGPKRHRGGVQAGLNIHLPPFGSKRPYD